MEGPAIARIEDLAALFDQGPVAVLTGAGVSTESGIPDYRGPETRRRARHPIQYRDFLHRPEARRRYWARSMLGWPRFSAALPNRGHAALSRLERAGLVGGLLTQNVDGLHHAAGSDAAIELHGALRTVVCMTCGALSCRHELQRALEGRNGELARARVELAPDGDAELDDDRLRAFQVIDCACGGALKPYVVFFGENVPKPRVEAAMLHVERAAALLVVGTSLAVYSGLRFVHAAAKRGIPIGIVTWGETRGDALATVRVDAAAGDTLMALADLVGA